LADRRKLAPRKKSFLSLKKYVFKDTIMKKAFLTILSCIVTLSLFAQNVEKEEAAKLAGQANPNLSMARKATIEWVKIYDLQGEQAVEALKIQESKYRNLASIEGMKAADKSAYVQKRMAALGVADGELYLLLDSRQKQIFQAQQEMKASKLASFTSNLKKDGFSDAAVNDQLANFDF
jgi:hypothetical protein